MNYIEGVSHMKEIVYSQLFRFGFEASSENSPKNNSDLSQSLRTNNQPTTSTEGVNMLILSLKVLSMIIVYFFITAVFDTCLILYKTKTQKKK